MNVERIGGIAIPCGSRRGRACEALAELAGAHRQKRYSTGGNSVG